MISRLDEFAKQVQMNKRAFLHLLMLLLVLSFALNIDATGRISAGLATERQQERTQRKASEERALIILSSESMAEMKNTISIIKQNSGSIDNVFPPHILIGTFPRSNEKVFIGKFGIEKICRDAVNTTQFEKYGDHARRGLEFWNRKYFGIDKHPELSKRGPDPGPIHNDLRFENRSTIAMPNASAVPPYGAGFYDTSEYMLGSMTILVIFPESNGAADPNTETWTQTDIDVVFAEIIGGVGWWKDREGNAQLSFTFCYYPTSQTATSYEPISRPSTDEYLWISQIMNGLGFSSYSSYWNKVRQANNYVRDFYGTDWAFTIFVVNSKSDADGKFTDGYFAYAYFGGPFMIMTYKNNGYGIENMDAVTAHEMGHIFYAADEYYQPGYNDPGWPSDKYGYLAVENQNLKGPGRSGSSDVPCIMRGGTAPYSSSSICQYTRGHVGWRDSNSDGVMDIVDFYPANSITSSPPYSDSTLYFLGQANSRQAYPNNNPWGQKHDITINKIVDVQYFVYNSQGAQIRGPLDATPVDGAFDSSLENWQFTADPLLPIGTYEFRIVAWNSVGKGLIIYGIWLTPNLVQITVTSSPAGAGFVTVDGNGITTPQTYSWLHGSAHTVAANSPVSAGTGIQYVWISWSDGGAQSHTITVPSSPATYTANFKKQYLLTVSVSPSGAGFLSVSSGWQDEGTTVPVTATPNSGYSFYYWSLDGVNMGSNPSISVAMNSPRSLTAMFRSTSSLSLGLSSGSISLGSSVTLSGTVTPTQPSPGIPAGTTVILSYSLTGGSWNVFIMTQTGSGGAYSVAWYPPYPGIYPIRASWNGNPNYEGATSGMLSLNVTGVVPPRVTLVLSGPSSAARGGSVTFEILVDNSGSALSATLYLEIVGPGGYRYFDFQRIIVGEGQRGRYQFSWQIPSGLSVGQYDVSAGLIPPKPTSIIQTQIAIV